jgi:epoxide hydrolase
MSDDIRPFRIEIPEADLDDLRDRVPPVPHRDRRRGPPREQVALASLARYNVDDSGYSKQQSTRPQTIGYGLVDSPALLCAWIVEKFWSWTDCDGDPATVLTRDEMLDNIMLY